MNSVDPAKNTIETSKNTKNTKETIRLECLCVFHLDCLISRLRQLPVTALQSDYKCFKCFAPIISNSNSVLNNVIKQQLKNEQWYYSYSNNNSYSNSNNKPVVEIQESTKFIGKQSTLIIDPDDQEYKNMTINGRDNNNKHYYYYYFVIILLLVGYFVII